MRRNSLLFHQSGKQGILTIGSGGFGGKNQMQPEGTNDELKRLQRGLNAAANIDSIRAAMNSYLHSVGSECSSYYHYPPIGAADFGPDILVYTHGFPPDWVEIYREEGYINVDPMPKIAASRTRAFRWSEISKIASLNAAEVDYLKRARDAGFGDGLAVPVFGPNGRNGYFAVGLGNTPFPDENAVAEIHWACQAVHLRFCDMILDALPSAVTLSERERQILGYVVRGHTNSWIAQELKLSANTIDTYVRRCFEKLNVNDRVTAGLRGLALGIVA